jgi:hypothetical protein
MSEELCIVQVGHCGEDRDKSSASSRECQDLRAAVVGIGLVA